MHEVRKIKDVLYKCCQLALKLQLPDKESAVMTDARS